MLLFVVFACFYGQHHAQNRTEQLESVQVDAEGPAQGGDRPDAVRRPTRPMPAHGAGVQLKNRTATLRDAHAAYADLSP